MELQQPCGDGIRAGFVHIAIVCLERQRQTPRKHTHTHTHRMSQRKRTREKTTKRDTLTVTLRRNSSLSDEISSPLHQRATKKKRHNRQTRHKASTSMYSLTFRVRVATPAQYGRNGTASLQITSHTPNLHVDFIAGACVRSACGVRWAWRITAGLCHAFP